MMAEFGLITYAFKPYCQQTGCYKTAIEFDDDAVQGGLNKCELILLAAGSPAACWPTWHAASA
jgi:hypothetical protein